MSDSRQRPDPSIKRNAEARVQRQARLRQKMTENPASRAALDTYQKEKAARASRAERDQPIIAAALAQFNRETQREKVEPKSILVGKFDPSRRTGTAKPHAKPAHATGGRGRGRPPGSKKPRPPRKRP